MSLQLSFFAPEVKYRPPRISELPSWAGASRVAIDCETCDPKLRAMGPGVRRGAYIAGVSFAIEDGPAEYLPLRHFGGDNMEEGPERVFHWLKEQAASFDGDIVGAKLDYDMDFLAQEGVWFKPRFFRDVQIAEPLIDELQDSYSLENICQRYSVPGKDEELLRAAASSFRLDPKKEMWKMPGRYVATYAKQDVVAPLVLLRRQERIIEEQDLWEIYNLESQVLPVIVKMRRRGVLVDQDRLAQIERWSHEEEAKALAEVRRITGVRIEVGDVWKPELLVPALEQQGIKVPRTVKGKASVDKDFMKRVKNPVADLIARARNVNKIRTTFAASVREHMCDGRIHTTFNQLRKQKDEDNPDSDEQGGGRFGRLSSENPNLQQQPARDPEIGPMWRGIYLPDPGGLWASNDYSQQEPRWAVHYSVKCKLPKAREAADKYINDPTTDNHQMMADMAGIKRKDAKEIYLGLIYGMGGAKMCRKLGLPTQWVVWDKELRRAIPTESEHGRKLLARGERSWEGAGEEGQNLINRFDTGAPFLRKLAKFAEKVAQKKGYVTTALGRHCRFPKNEKGDYDWTHKALNRIIQGSSADQTKKAMVDIEAAGYELQLQVHDEVDTTVENREHAEAIAEIMRTCVPMEVPSKVDVEIGPSWGEAK